MPGDQGELRIHSSPPEQALPQGSRIIALISSISRVRQRGIELDNMIRGTKDLNSGLY